MLKKASYVLARSPAGFFILSLHTWSRSFLHTAPGAAPGELLYAFGWRVTPAGYEREACCPSCEERFQLTLRVDFRRRRFRHFHRVVWITPKNAWWRQPSFEAPTPNLRWTLARLEVLSTYGLRAGDANTVRVPFLLTKRA